MIYTVDHIPKNTPCNRRPGLPLVPEYVTVHSTGNPRSTARNERDWLTNPANKRTASWHICVDEREAIEAIPLAEVAWHAGDGGNGPGNRRSIAIEICESSNRAKTLQNAIELAADLLRRLGLGADRLRRHWDWSKKPCPRIFMADNWAGWEAFKGEVEKRLKSKPETLPQIQRRVEGTLNGRPLEFETYLINNTTYVPLRPLAEVLGLHVIWQEGKYHIFVPQADARLGC